MPIWLSPFPQVNKMAATLVVIFQVLSMRVAKSQVGVMRTDSVFLLFLGFWVFATKEMAVSQKRKPEQHGESESLLYTTETHNYNLFKARMLALKEWIRCIDNSGIFPQNHHRIKSQIEIREKLNHLKFLLLHFTTYLQESSVFDFFDSNQQILLKIIMIPHMSCEVSL